MNQQQFPDLQTQVGSLIVVDNTIYVNPPAMVSVIVPSCDVMYDECCRYRTMLIRIDGGAVGDPK